MTISKRHPATVVIFPTLLTGSWVWREQRAILTSISPNVVEWPDAIVNWDVQPSLTAIDACVLARLEASPTPWLLVGCSLGALIALRTSLREPDAVSAVIATGSPGLGRNDDLMFRAKLRLTFNDAAEVRAMLFADPSRVGDPILRDTLAEIGNRPALYRGTRLVREIGRYGAREDLIHLTAPASLIWGENDRLTPPAPWSALAEQCGAMNFNIIPDAGHAPMLEVPDEFNKVLLGELARLGISRAPPPA